MVEISAKRCILKGKTEIGVGRNLKNWIEEARMEKPGRKRQNERDRIKGAE